MTTTKHNPQVLHIGFSKCASTYLRALFRAHPRIHLVFKSGFFTPLLASPMSFADYQDLFRSEDEVVNVESDEHLTLPGIHPELGVRCTNLSEFSIVADRIRHYLPEVRLIMVIRNQASLMVSRYSEFLIKGGSIAFEEFASALMGQAGGMNVTYQNYYRQIIRILEQRFPAQNLLVLVQEAMREDTEKVAAKLSRFLMLNEGLVPMKGLLAERRSLSYFAMKLLALLNKQLVIRPSFGDTPPKTRVPVEVFRNVVRAVRAIDYFALSHLSPKSSKVLSPERKREILTHFLHDNHELQQYLGRDLGKFGYFGDQSSLTPP